MQLNKNDNIKKIEKIINYQFKDKNLIEKALTHSSVNHKDNYENLEFLGDSVLELIITSYLYNQNLGYDEGQLTKLRAKIVSEKPLSKVITKLEIYKYIFVGISEEKQNIRDLSSIKCDVFESITGAMYLDSDIEVVTGYVLDILKDTIIQVINGNEIEDFKSLLLEYGAKNNKKVEYILVKQSGPAHEPIFEFNVLLDEKVVGSGAGSSKKIAQQTASKIALNNLGIK